MKLAERCRNCGHDQHGNTFGNSCPVFFCDYNDNGTGPEYCDCVDYVPSGNLEYLAWKHEKKQKDNLQESL